METLFKEGPKKIMGLFYKEKNRKIHLRQIARETELNENSVTRFLSMLERGSILKSEKEGNLKKYSIQKNKEVCALFTLFDIKKYERLPGRRKRAITYFIEELVEKPIIVIVFGSTAKEKYSDNSDIDLLLIVNKKISVEKAESSAEAQTGIRVSSIQMGYGQFRKELKIKEDHVIASAVFSGYPVTNHITYYEEVLQ